MADQDFITQSELKELLHYDAETGLFTWRKTVNSRAVSGSIAGCIVHDGYVSIKINKKRYYGHRLAWLYIYGSFPVSDLDHINCITSDNRISNLRNAECRLNNQNLRTPSARNKSGLLGASWKESHKRWESRICVNGKRMHIGYFDTAQEAHEAYVYKKRMLHEFCTL